MLKVDEDLENVFTCKQVSIEKHKEIKMGEKVFVQGFGLMGSGIAQVFAQAGYQVVATDVDDGILQKGMSSITQSVSKFVEKGTVKGSKEEILGRIRTTRNVDEAADAALVVEAVYEDMQLKKKTFEKLDAICPATTILASNTSGLLITDIASATKRPERMVGTHFFSPPQMMRLVEVVRGFLTSDETVNQIKKWIESIGKEAIVVEKEVPGFVVNRINGMVYLEALRLLEQGVATAADIDKGLKLGTGYAMGPFEVMDLIGLDTLLKSRMGIYEQTKDIRFYPPDILRKMVSAGFLGRKTRKGFYEYTPDGKKKG